MSVIVYTTPAIPPLTVTVQAPTHRRRARQGGPTGTPLPTVRDVARVAGVSTASVSRALNAPETVTSALLDRVTMAVAALGYVRNTAGRALASMRSGIVGVALPCLGDRDHDRILAAFEERLRTAGYLLAVAVAADPDAGAALRRLWALSPEGVVSIGLGGLDEVREIPRRRMSPYVEVAGDGDPGAATRIGIDLTRGAQTVARYLYGLGHRRFALLASEATRALEVGRADALRRALAELPGASVVEAAGRFGDADRLATVVDRLMQPALRPTAIVCADDHLAMAGLRGCERAGLAVPGNVSIIGCGDCDVARYARPPLTSLRLPLAEAGARAAEVLLARLSGSDAPVEPLRARLIVRASSGSPAG